MTGPRVNRDKVIQLLNEGLHYRQVAEEHWSEIRTNPQDKHPVSRQAIALIAQWARQENRLSEAAVSRMKPAGNKTRVRIMAKS